MQKNSYITVTDQFCGAGGSSQGARAAGLEVKLALNHWTRAIETHQANFPETDHECTDISAADPRRYRSTDILITSPECTNHSLAKGQKQVKAQLSLYEKGVLDAAAERSRATMWDVCRFAEYHKYNIIIVENVVDARKWVMWDAWLMAMHSLGYMHKCVYLNSMHCQPTPQSRDRMYVVFWKKGNRAPVLDYTPKAHCPKCAKDVASVQYWKNSSKPYGKYRSQYLYKCPNCTTTVEPYYYASFNVIDWSDIGKRIGDREKPLSPNTLRRIEHGLKKYSGHPYIIHTAYGNEARGVERSIVNSAFTQTTFNSQAIINPPFIINNQHSTGVGFRVKSCSEVIPTMPSQHSLSLIMPMVLKAEHTKQDNIRSAAESFQTQTTRQTMGLLIPHIVEMNKTGECKPSTEPTATFTAGGINHGLVTTEAWNSFLHYNYGNDTMSHISNALGTVTTKDRAGIVTYDTPKVEDCYYRMFKPHEVKLAMAFERDYIVTGSGKDQVRQLGNAVTPPAMEWLVKQCVASLN